MEVKFSTNVTAKELYKFSLNNVYRKFTGIIWILFSIVVVVVTVVTWGKVDISRSILMILLACIYTVINPVGLWLRSKRQVNSNKSFQKPLNYTINETGITINQDELSDTVKWPQMWKSVKYGKLIIVYVSTIRAFIIPIKDVEDQYDNLVTLLDGGLKARNYVKRK